MWMAASACTSPASDPRRCFRMACRRTHVPSHPSPFSSEDFQSQLLPSGRSAHEPSFVQKHD